MAEIDLVTLLVLPLTLGLVAAFVGAVFVGLQWAGWIALGGLYVALGAVYLAGKAGSLRAQPRAAVQHPRRRRPADSVRAEHPGLRRTASWSRSSARRALDRLSARSVRVPMLIGLLFTGLGIWPVYFGLFVTPEA